MQQERQSPSWLGRLLAGAGKHRAALRRQSALNRAMAELNERDLRDIGFVRDFHAGGRRFDPWL